MSVIAPPPNPIRYDGTRQHPLRQFHVAIANAANAPCDIAVMGDSIGEGALITTDRHLRWVERMLAKLRAKHQPAGVTGGEGYVPTRYNISPSPVSPWVASGGGLSQLTGLGLRTRNMTASGNTLTLTATGTRFTLIHPTGTGLGSFSWALDGGGATTVDVSAGSFASTGTTAIPTGSSASHTLLLSRVSGTTYIDGAMVFDGDESAGIRLWDCSSGGAKSDFYRDGLGVNADNWSLILGSIVSPDLVIIALGGNDASTGLNTPDQVKANLATKIALIRTRCAPDPSIVLIVGYDWPNFTAGAWLPYRAATYAAAIEDGNVGVIDLYQRFGAKADLSSLGLVSDGVHPTALGHEFYANAVAGYLEP